MDLKIYNFAAIRSAVKSVEGLLVPGQGEFLFNKVKSLPEDAIIIEIGSYKGYSSIAMGYACVGTGRKIYCIDTWSGKDLDIGISNEKNIYPFWQENIKKNNLQDYVISLIGRSQDILIQWNELVGDKEVDFVFIDGSHQYSDVLKDFELSYSMVKDGGWIAFHDVGDGKGWPGPYYVWHEKAKNILINHHRFSTLVCGQKLNKRKFLR